MGNLGITDGAIAFHCILFDEDYYMALCKYFYHRLPTYILWIIMLLLHQILNGIHANT